MNIVEYHGIRGGAEAEVVRENFQAEGLSAEDGFFFRGAKFDWWPSLARSFNLPLTGRISIA